MPEASSAPADADVGDKHVPALDGVRALAILTVLVHQVLQVDALQGPIGAVLRLAARHGSAGVTLFFVLSGFLITRNLIALADREQRYRTFYGRRVLRIFPIYYVVVFGYCVLQHHEPLRAQLPIWFFVSNWTQPFGDGPGPLPHFWSLAVEEQFYLVWPLVVFHCDRRQLLIACAAVAAVAILSRVVLIASGVPALAVYTFSISRMDALALGSAIAAWLQTPQARLTLRRVRHRLWFAAAAAASCHVIASTLLKSWAPAYAQVSYHTMTALVSCALVLAAIAADQPPSRWWTRALSSRPMRLIGKHSYAMYVLQLPVALQVSAALMHGLNGDGPVGVAAALAHLVVLTAIVFAAAWACYVVFERYFLRLREVWFPMPASKQL